MMNRYFIPLLLAALLLTACDAHIEYPDNSLAVGQVLCTDGQIIRYDSLKGSGKEPIAVVFYVNHDEGIEGRGYAVYLWDVEPAAFTDSIGIPQGTSTDVDACDGNANTYAMYAGKDAKSPLAEKVYDLWKYGQSAYIPSVAQMRFLKEVKAQINPAIEACGGEPLSDSADECWYWTSTEVEGQDKEKAWLYSMKSGAVQETPKLLSHKARPVITINY